MAGYQGFSLESDGSSLKQVDTTSGKRKSNKNSSNGGNSSNRAGLGGGLARDAKNKVDKKNKSSGNKDKTNGGNLSNKNLVEKIVDVAKNSFEPFKEVVEEKGKAARELAREFQEVKEERLKKREQEEIVQKEQEQLVQNNVSEQQSDQNTQNEDETKTKTQDDTVYSSQNEWLLSFLAGASKNKASIREISDEERRIIIDKMEKYWRNNLGRGLSVEYLVNGAVMRCACGKTLFNIVGKDHKVYTDSTEQLAMLNDTDKRLSSGCKVCDYVGYSYAYEDLEWVEKSNIEIGDNNSKALTMNSYMLCTLKQDSNKAEVGEHFKNYFNKYKNSQSETMAKELENNLKEAANIREQAQGKPGIIKPVTSGQEFTIGSKIFIYPKFISDIHSDKDAFDTYWETHDFGKNCPIDSGVVKRLMTRNFERMSDTEKLWFYRLAKFFILSKDNDTIRNLLNIFIDGKKNLKLLSITEVCDLRDNFSILIQCADFYLKVLYNSTSSSSAVIDIVVRNYMLLRHIAKEQIYVTSGDFEKPIDEVKSVSGDDAKYYEETGMVVLYYVADYKNSRSLPYIAIKPAEVKFSGSKQGESATLLMTEVINKINADNQNKWYITMLSVNIAATVLLGLIPEQSASIGLSVVWTFISSVISVDDVNVQSLDKNTLFKLDTLNVNRFIDVFSANVSYIKDDILDGHLSYILFPSDESRTKIDNFLTNMARMKCDGKKLIEKLGISEDIYASSVLKLKLGNIEISTDNTYYYRLSKLAEALTLVRIKDGTDMVSGLKLIINGGRNWEIDGKKLEREGEKTPDNVIIEELFSEMTTGIISLE